MQRISINRKETFQTIKRLEKTFNRYVIKDVGAGEESACLSSARP
jgi:hypothetical protein